MYVVTTVAESSGSAAFNAPRSLVVTSGAEIFVMDSMNNKVRKILTSGVVTTFAGSGAAMSVDGAGVSASFNQSKGIAMNTNGWIYVAEYSGHRIRKISTAAFVTTYAGSGQATFADGVGTSAGIYLPLDITFDSLGNLYIVTGENRVRKISTAAVVTTLAGSGSAAYGDGVGTAASFNVPSGICIDTSNTLFITDTRNNRIRQVKLSGVVTTVAGSGAMGFADGIGSAAVLYSPLSCKMYSNGTIIFSDDANYVVRLMARTGAVTTLAGSGSTGFVDGLGSSASFMSVSGAYVDSSSNAYIADYRSNVIRKISQGDIKSNQLIKTIF